jgi:hypothetical protein
MPSSSQAFSERSSPADLAQLALDAATTSAWRQWSTLGAAGGTTTVGADTTATIVDPEALVLASLALAPHERRLADFLLWWAHIGAPLLSVQRTRSLLSFMPGETEQALAAFAASAVDAGDRRWKRLAGPDGLEARLGKGAERPDLTHPAALLLRLRAGLGVSAKADLLAVLLGTDRPATVRALAEATGYSTVAVRVALGEMAGLARFAEATEDYPTSYRIADNPAWSALLTPDQPLPRWGYWAAAFPALLAVDDWGRRAKADGWSPYVASSKARDLVERHALAFRHLAPDAPRLDAYRGEAALAPFAEAVYTLVRTTGGDLAN